MYSLGVATVMLTMIGMGGNPACVEGGCCGKGGGHFQYQPSVTYYAPYPYWWPNYFAGPPYSDYQVIQYVTPPAESALIVKERINAINAANPALLPPAQEPLPFPQPGNQTPKTP
jgi:hypothetical protein